MTCQVSIVVLANANYPFDREQCLLDSVA